MSSVRNVNISSPSILSRLAREIHAFQGAYKNKLSHIHNLLLLRMQNLVRLKDAIDSRVQEIEEELYYARLAYQNCLDDAHNDDMDEYDAANYCSSEHDDVNELENKLAKAKAAQGSAQSLLDEGQYWFNVMRGEILSLPNHIDPLCDNGIRTLDELQSLLEDYLRKKRSGAV